MYNQEQLIQINEFKQSGVAFASMAFRNNGTVKPITVMLEGYSSDEVTSANPNGNANSTSFHLQMMSKFTGINLVKRNTLLINFSEEQFDQMFSAFGVTHDMVDFGYRDSDNNFIGTPLLVSTEHIVGQEVSLIRVDSTDEEETLDEKGEPKNNWQPKMVNGEVLTKDGDTIYHRVIIAPLGSRNKRIAQDQNFSRRDLSTVLENARNAEVTRQEAPVAI
jgi:hypothetical protein